MQVIPSIENESHCLKAARKAGVIYPQTGKENVSDINQPPQAGSRLRYLRSPRAPACSQRRWGAVQPVKWAQFSTEGLISSR